MRAAGRPIAAEIRRGLLLALVLASCALLLMLHAGITRLADDFVLSRLQHDAESLLRAIEFDADGGFAVADRRLPAVYERVGSGHYYVIRGPGGELRSRSLWDTAAPAMAGPGTNPGRRHVTVGEERWLVWQQPVRTAIGELSLWIAEDIAPLRRYQWRFEVFVLCLLAVFVPLLLWFQGRVLRRAFAGLRPLEAALEARLRGGDASLPASVPAEVAPLADAFRDLLQQQDQQLTRGRTAAGNLAHELKRPLQLLLDIAGERRDSRLREVYRALQETVQRELRRARIAGSPTPGRLFHPSQDIPDLCRVLQQVTGRSVELDSEVPGDPVPFDRDDMLELFGNLLDNAWRHSERRIALRFSKAGHAPEWVLQVDDDGPGVPAAQRRDLTRRGARLDEEGVQAQGHGLGLSLCRAVVDGYRGRLEFDASPLGGLRVTATLSSERRTPQAGEGQRP